MFDSGVCCSYCGTRNSRERQTCSNCGAPRGEAPVIRTAAVYWPPAPTAGELAAGEEMATALKRAGKWHPEPLTGRRESTQLQVMRARRAARRARRNEG